MHLYCICGWTQLRPPDKPFQFLKPGAEICWPWGHPRQTCKLPYMLELPPTNPNGRLFFSPSLWVPSRRGWFQISPKALKVSQVEVWGLGSGKCVAFLPGQKLISGYKFTKWDQGPRRPSTLRKEWFWWLLWFYNMGNKAHWPKPKEWTWRQEVQWEVQYPASSGQAHPGSS